MRFKSIYLLSLIVLASCQPPESEGCTDLEAMNYDSVAVIDDGSCEFNSFECPANDADTFAGSCSPVTYDGYTYDVVQIGDQCWFAENLRTTKYSNGDPVASGLTKNQWLSTTSGAMSVYGEEVLLGEGTLTAGDSDCYSHAQLDYDACDENESLQLFGRLYNWYAATDYRGLCPSGWHVPTRSTYWSESSEWGVFELAVNGTSIKEEFGWHPEGTNGSNETGFSALPGGRRTDYSTFFDVGFWGFFWGSCEFTGSYYDTSYANAQMISHYGDEGACTWNGYKKSSGLSVRCIKD